MFLTYGAVAERYPVGLAVQGVTCHPNKRFRTSISRYIDTLCNFLFFLLLSCLW